MQSRPICSAGLHSPGRLLARQDACCPPRNRPALGHGWHRLWRMKRSLLLSINLMRGNPSANWQDSCASLLSAPFEQRPRAIPADRLAGSLHRLGIVANQSLLKPWPCWRCWKPCEAGRKIGETGTVHSSHNACQRPQGRPENLPANPMIGELWRGFFVQFSACRIYCGVSECRTA